MPPREKPPGGFEDRVTADFARDLQTVEDRLVLEAGPPPDSERLSEADEDTLWALKDLKIDRDALAQRLLTEGLPPEEAEQLAVVREMPDWLPLYGQATQDAEMADQLARMAEFPYRWPLLADIDDPDEMVKKADRLQARYERKHGAQEAAEDLQVTLHSAVPPTPVPPWSEPPAQPMLPQESMNGQGAMSLPLGG